MQLTNMFRLVSKQAFKPVGVLPYRRAITTTLVSSKFNSIQSGWQTLTTWLRDTTPATIGRKLPAVIQPTIQLASSLLLAMLPGDVLEWNRWASQLSSDTKIVLISG